MRLFLFSKFVIATLALANLSFTALAHGDHGKQTWSATSQHVSQLAAKALQLPAGATLEQRLKFGLKYAAGVELLDVQIKREFGRSTVTFDLGKDALNLEPGSAAFENALHRLHVQSHDLLTQSLGQVSYQATILGQSLRAFLSHEQALVADSLAPADQQRLHAKSSDTRRIGLSPGHGWIRNDAGTAWGLQRGYLFGIVEDFINHELIIGIDENLRKLGYATRPMRELNRNLGIGETGFPKWQESSRYYVKSLGVPSTVWDSSSVDLNDDIRVRPLFANWKDANGNNAEVLVSVHNNGGGGTGTETLYDTDNGFGVENEKLAKAVHARIINEIRAQYSPTWRDRGPKGFAGSYGENRLATRPAIIVELAFMDTKSDNDALQDPRFRAIANDAITKGIQDYLSARVDTVEPSAPASVRATAINNRQIDVEWSPASDDLGVTGYRVFRNDGKSDVQIGAVAASAPLRFTDADLAPGTQYSYSVSARDAAGNWGKSAAVVGKTNAAEPYHGMWWNAAESGWGMSLTQHNNIIFAAIYTYDAAGKPAWYVMSRCELSTASLSATSCTDDIYRVTGGTIPTDEWGSPNITLQNVGKGVLSFSSQSAGLFEFAINGVTGRKSIIPFQFVTSSERQKVDYTDLWWNDKESGWGMAITQQNNVMFLAWYSYDANRNPLWYVASNCELIGQQCKGKLFTVSGGGALTQPWPSTAPVSTEVGDVTITFSDASTGVMIYTINGKSLSKAITRLRF